MEIKLKTPMKIWTRKPTNYSYLHVFGCSMCVMYNVQKKNKTGSKIQNMCLLGIYCGVKGYHLWDPNDYKIIINRDVYRRSTTKERWDGSTIKEKKKVNACIGIYGK